MKIWSLTFLWIKENVDCPTSFKYGVGPLNICLFVLLWTLKHKDGKYGLGLEGQNNENMVVIPKLPKMAKLPKQSQTL